MRFFHPSTAILTFVILTACFATGCAQEISRDQLAQKVGQPGDVKFFGDQAMYMGDFEGYRYVHVHDLFGCITFLGECEYKIPESQWPMKNPMPYTSNANDWQDVTWMNGDGPAGVPENPFLHITPSFPLGAPATQPTTVPASKNAER